MTDPLLGAFPEWLAVELADRRRHAGADDLHAAICRELCRMGLPIWRSTLSLETLHPVENSRQSIWIDGDVDIRRRERQPTWGDEYMRSPVRIVDETQQPYRHVLGRGDHDMPLLHELEEAGATDYLLVPLPFIDDVRTAAISFATRAPGGFGAHDIARLHRATQVMGPLFERGVIRAIAVNLLDTYVGPRSGEQVYAGGIDRNAVTRIEAAVLFGDLRNFTGLTNALPPERVIGLLDDWFDLVGAAVAGQGGEILKFMGDGILAIFPAGTGSLDVVCRRAVAAARAILAGGDTLRIDVGGSARPVGFGLGLHVGEIAWGNVGTRTRLDFTVIGPAVNLASRLQGLTAILGAPAVASAAIAARLDEALEPLGLHDLRGFDDPVAVLRI